MRQIIASFVRWPFCVGNSYVMTQEFRLDHVMAKKATAKPRAPSLFTPAD